MLEQQQSRLTHYFNISFLFSRDYIFGGWDLHYSMTSALRLVGSSLRQLLQPRHPALRHVAATGPSSRSQSTLSSSSPTPTAIKPMTREQIFSTYPPQSGAVIREAWVESMAKATDADAADSGEAAAAPPAPTLVPLHPDVWSVRPRIDIIKNNVDWQLKYKHVSFLHTKDRHEMKGGTKRPWPQKGTGRARHRTTRSPIWVNGGKCFGPKSPRSHYYMLPYDQRVNGLIHTLSVKFAQDDVHVVDSLEIPSDDPKYLDDLIDERGWGLSTLLVDCSDVMPANVTASTEGLLHVNLLPVYGLNVHSMLKHKTLVLTVDALNRLEEKLLFALNRVDIREVAVKSWNPEKYPA